MNDIFLTVAGALGMLIAVIHGYLGEIKVVAPITGSPTSAKRIMQAIMFLSAIYWFVGGAILMATPYLFEGTARTFAIAFIGFLYLSGAIGNFWATRGRHIGWVLLSLTTLLIWMGA